MADVRRLPGPVADRWDWQLRAACRTADSAEFFVDSERGPEREAHERRAKALCARCPVLAACREHALRVREPYGVWGGMTAKERAAEIRAPRAAA